MIFLVSAAEDYMKRYEIQFLTNHAEHKICIVKQCMRIFFNLSLNRHCKEVTQKISDEKQKCRKKEIFIGKNKKCKIMHEE